MAITENDGLVEIVATGGEAELDFDFKLLERSDLLVKQNAIALTLDLHYTIPDESLDEDDGGSIVLDPVTYFPDGATEGDVFTLELDPPCAREGDFQPGDGITRWQTHNNEYDRIWQYLQRLKRLVGPAIDLVSASITSIEAVAAWLAAGGSLASEVTYDNGLSELSATDVQDAIDEIVTSIDDVLDALSSGIVLLEGDQSIDGKKTFTSSPVIPVGTEDGDALEYSQLAWKHIMTVDPEGMRNVDFSNLSAYRLLRLTFELSPEDDNADLRVRTSTDNGSTFDAGASDYSFELLGVSEVGVGESTDTSSDEITIVTAVGDGQPANGTVHFFNFNTSYASIKAEVISRDLNGDWYNTFVGGRRNSSTGCNAFRLSFESGDISSGLVTLEGIKG